MIQFERIQKDYSDFHLALDMQIEKGELVSILGPSGSGKTTTLRLIAGFEKADSGRILLEGRDVTGLDPAKRRIGFVFQDYTLFPHMDVGRNIAYGLKNRKVPEKEIFRRVKQLLATIGLEGYEGRSIDTLSGGERQRVAIARALAVDPLLFLLDEPFSSIDAPLRRELREGIVNLQKELGVTTVFVTHSRQEALSISDRVAVMRDGALVQFDTPMALYEAPRSRFVAAFAGTANFFPGKIVGRENGVLLFRGRNTFRIRSAEPPDTAGELTLMVRPNRLRFVSRSFSGENGFPVKILSCQYYGHYFEYLCDADGLRCTVYDTEKRQSGENGMLAFEAEHGVLLAE